MRVVTSPGSSSTARSFSGSRTATRRTTMRAPSRASMSSACCRRIERTPPPTTPNPAIPIPTSRIPHLPPTRWERSTARTCGVAFPSTTANVSIRTGPTPGA